ncbi:MAG: hypothetical protein ACLGIO_00035 [Acidimicrobiia bacterium]
MGSRSDTRPELTRPAGRGLTATLPDPDSRREAENYRGVLGDVDAELHLAAMVAEGAVAPWRDGLRLAPLTPTESRFLDSWSERLAGDLDEHLTGEAFVGWAVAQVCGPALDARAAARPVLAGGGAGASGPDGWDSFWDRDPLAAAALVVGPRPGAAGRLRSTAGRRGPLGLADRLVLVDAWLHDPLAAVDPPQREVLGRLAGRYGVSFTTAGVGWGRSVADLVCARSSAKGPAAADVLAAEGPGGVTGCGPWSSSSATGPPPRRRRPGGCWARTPGPPPASSPPCAPAPRSPSGASWPSPDAARGWVPEPPAPPAPPSTSPPGPGAGCRPRGARSPAPCASPATGRDGARPGGWRRRRRPWRAAPCGCSWPPGAWWARGGTTRRSTWWSTSRRWPAARP